MVLSRGGIRKASCGAGISQAKGSRAAREERVACGRPGAGQGEQQMGLDRERESEQAAGWAECSWVDRMQPQKV